MGIYDRDYTRREGPSFLGSFVERGQVCRWLIGINVAVFVAQILTLPGTGLDGLGWFTETFDLKADRVLQGQVWRLLTYGFLHDPWTIWHIVFNMLFLWWFGSDVEDLYGPREFLWFYLLSVVVAGVGFILSSLLWIRGAPCLGASGGIMAVLLVCAFHYPRRVIYLFFFIPVPIWLFIGFMLVSDAFLFLHRADTGTAVAAHLSGAVFGALYYQQQWRVTGWLPQIHLWRRQLFRPRLRVYREEEEDAPAPVPVPAAGGEDEQLEAQMDAILEKISRVGKENLTESEREVLLRASEIYRRRRS
jgi:membrane associated rhomboid family serine protease